jgi:hypothetical protein
MPPRKAPDSGPEPPFYEAAEDLYVHHPEAGVMPALAYKAGDKVTTDVIDANGWREKVAIPAEFADQFTPAAPAPAQATSPAGIPAGGSEK